MSAKPIEPQPGIMPPGVMPMDKLVHLALPVRLTHMQNGERCGPEMACTYDIHPRGARLLSFRGVKVGDLITVERGRNKSICQVVWTADPDSALRGQFTVECVEGAKTPWEDELRQMQEQYLPINPDAPKKKSSMNTFGRTDQNRRRHPRFDVEGGADLLQIGGQSSLEGQVEQISGYGCLVSASNLLVPGTGLKVGTEYLRCERRSERQCSLYGGKSRHGRGISRDPPGRSSLAGLRAETSERMSE